MKEERIVIEISREGGISANADGFIGGACLEQIDALLDGLTGGVETLERKRDARDARVTRRQRAGSKR